MPEVGAGAVGGVTPVQPASQSHPINPAKRGASSARRRMRMVVNRVPSGVSL